MDFKKLLKKNSLIYGVNARIKSFLTSRASGRVSLYYEELASRSGIIYDRNVSKQLVEERLKKRGLSLKKTPKGDLRILLVGTNKEQDCSGMLQGLERFGPVFQFKNRYGVYGLEPNSLKRDPVICAANSEQLLRQIEAVYRAGGRIDVLIGQMWATHISAEALRRVQELGIITVAIAMDDRLPELWLPLKSPRGPVGLVAGLDLVLTTCEDCCVRYLAHGCPAIFWPMGSDPKLFRPASVKDIDVCFVGNNYGSRGEIIGKLMKSGVRVSAYGNGWPNGYIGPEKIAALFARSKIVLGVGTVAYNRDIFTLKLRDFDATMAGALYLTHRSREISRIFTEGREIECYSSPEEAVGKISYFLSHPEHREKIAAEAYMVSRVKHTWEARINEAFSVLGLIN